ncbi:MAG: hypothetical protein E7A62_04370 [Actinomycetaceae bacterium]|nr:hypothetical protein [Actinomycetaceae bacterium]MDU0970221.1 hypothetical protein [Actinomycetaceae bacterium]
MSSNDPMIKKAVEEFYAADAKSQWVFRDFFAVAPATTMDVWRRVGNYEGHVPHRYFSMSSPDYKYVGFQADVTAHMPSDVDPRVTAREFSEMCGVGRRHDRAETQQRRSAPTAP